MGFDNECVLHIESVPWEYFCISCRTLVYPNEAMQAPCNHLLCTPCLAGTNSCPDDFSILTENNCKALSRSNKQLAEMIGKVMVCCLNHKCGCQWQGTLSDYVAHGAICAFGNTNIQPQRAAQFYNVLPPIKQQVDSGQAPSLAVGTNEITQYGSLGSTGAILVDTIVEATSPAAVLTENPASHIAMPQPFAHLPSCPAEDLHEMARKYANAHYLWTWHERTIENRTVLSNPKDHDEGMSLFISTTLALEANFRVNGYDVKELSPYKLYEQYIHMNNPSFSGLSKLLKVAEILKSTGTEEINHDGIPSKTYSISNYKTFNTKTLEGLSEALDHLRIHGPLVGVYFVTKYQRRNADSCGILHGVEYVLGDTLYEVTDDQTAATSSTNAICITGFGVEDSTSFFQFQKFQRLRDDSKIFGRVLVSSVLELVGFFC